MSKFSVVDTEKLDNDLKEVADVIRENSEEKSQLVFPEEFKTAIGKIFPTLDINTQAELISQIKKALKGKAVESGSLPSGYERCDYIMFTGESYIDTGFIGNQDTQITTAFTWEDSNNSAGRYLFGCESANNTNGITAYLNGYWRFGKKYASKSLTSKNPYIPLSVLINKTTIALAASITSISDTNEFETIGTLLAGAARLSNGNLPTSGIYGKMLYFNIWQDDILVLKLIPVTNGTSYRFWDIIEKKFYDSITNTPLDGGNFTNLS